MKKVGVIGSGMVGETLANGFIKHGYEVMRGSRDVEKLASWKNKSGPKALTGTFQETARFGTILVLAVKGHGAESAVQMCGLENLKEKVIIDATNPIAEAPPVHGVLKFFTTFDLSLMERLQKLAPQAHFVKAFSCVGSALMINPKLPGGKPTMFICGNNQNAKSITTEILTQFGWDTEDMGPVEAARAIEPLCMLWCIPGFAKNQWMHAFKLLKA